MRDPKSYLFASARKQAVWIAASMSVFLIVSLIDYKWVKWGALPVYIIGVGLLVYCKFKGATHFGAKSWIEFPGFSLAAVADGDPRWHPGDRVALERIPPAPPDDQAADLRERLRRRRCCSWRYNRSSAA